MNRTQEQLIRTGKELLPDPYEGTFSFPEWSDWRLEQRMTDLMDSSQIPHGEPRKSNLHRELSHLIFEVTWRQKDGRGSEILQQAS